MKVQAFVGNDIFELQEKIQNFLDSHTGISFVSLSLAMENHCYRAILIYKE